MNEHKPGLGGLLAHGVCCGSLLLIYFAMKNPILLLYVVGPVVLGGILTGAFIGLDRAWTRRRRYREALLKRYERKSAFPDGNRRFLLGGAARTSNNSASPKAERVA